MTTGLSQLNKLPEHRFRAYFLAADQLLASGERPTNQKVQTVVGGSMQTATEAMQAWWHSLSGRISYFQDHPKLPKAVVDAADQMLRLARKQAELELAAATEALKEKEAAAKASVKAVQQVNEELTARLTAAEKTVAQQVESLAEAETALANRQQALAEAAENETRLNSILEEKEKSIRQLKEKMIHKESQYRLLEREYAHATAEGKSLETRLKESKAIESRQRVEISQARDQQKEMAKRINTLADHLEEQKELVQTKDRLLDQHAVKADHCSQQLADARKRIDVLEETVQTSTDGLAACRSRRQAVEKVLIRCRQQRDEQIRWTKRVQQEKQALEADFQSLRERLKNLEALNTALQRQLIEYGNPGSASSGS